MINILDININGTDYKTGAIVLIVVLVLALAFLAGLLFKKFTKKNSVEGEPSILDINSNGVPNQSDNSEFKYGYEKEATVVMNPVDPTTNVQNTKEVTPETVNTPAQEVVNDSNINKEPELNTVTEPIENPALDAQTVEQPVEEKIEEPVVQETTNITEEPEVKNETESVEVPAENPALDAQLTENTTSPEVVNETDSATEPAVENPVEETTNEDVLSAPIPDISPEQFMDAAEENKTEVETPVQTDNTENN